MRKAALHNLGCKVNACETEAMRQILMEAGYEIVPFTESADVYVVNTCTVTNIADRKSRQMLHRAKSKNPSAVIVAAGCYVQTHEEEVRGDSAVDILIGNDRKHLLPEYIDRFLEESQGYVSGGAPVKRRGDVPSRAPAERQDGDEPAVIDIAHTSEFEDMPVTRAPGHTRAFIKVQDGCDRFCSYCAIPYARGRVRSRSIESAAAEASLLARKGVKEVVLTGIHLSSYGADSGEELLRLIREIHGIDGIERIRLGSLEPKIVTEEFAGELSELSKLCPHFHLSLQSGCDATLARMNRRYTTEEYEEGCRILRAAFEEPAITTDVIVGFPGETAEEFETTEQFLRRIHFYEMHIFKYSRREGTRAAVMEHQVPEQIKAVRSSRLIRLAEEMSVEYRRRCLGSARQVLFEEQTRIEGEPYYVGYTPEYIRVAKSSRQSLENRLVTGTVKSLLTPEILLME